MIVSFIYFAINLNKKFAYDILAGAYGNLFTHVVLFIAISVAIFAGDVQKAKEKK